MAVGPEFPLRVVSSGGIYVQKDREVPDTFFMNVDYPSWTMQLACSVTSGKGAPLVFHGSEGTLMVAEDSEAFANTEMVVVPDRDYKDDFVKKTGKEELKIEVKPFVRGEHPHMDNFLDSMRSREKPNLDAELGYRAMAAIGMGVTAYRKGKVMQMDPAHAEADVALPPPRRGGALPLPAERQRRSPQKPTVGPGEGRTRRRAPGFGGCHCIGRSATNCASPKSRWTCQ